MSDRMYTAEDVLYMVRRVFDIFVVKNKKTGHFGASCVFPTKDGYMANVFRETCEHEHDEYDTIYYLLYQIASTKENGELPSNVMRLEEGEGHPLDVAIDIVSEPHE